jgi:predicted amidohydrolase YtcJ
MSRDTLLRGARLGPEASPQDVLVVDGRVAAIGHPDTRLGEGDEVQVAGRFVLPGLWDHHVHFDQWAQVRARLDLSTAESAAGAVRLVAESLDRRGRGSATPLVGYGFRDALWPDLPHRKLLDRVAGDVPVVLISADLHCAWLNTAALRRFAEDADHTGVLREDAAMRVTGEVAVVAEDVGDAWADDAARAAAARGVVGIVDMEKPWPLPAWRRRMAAGQRSLRVRASVWSGCLADVIEQGLRTNDVVDDTLGLLTVGPFKVITDGSLNTRTAYCHDAYQGVPDDTGGCGLSLVSEPDLVELMRRATSAGLTCAVHAIGDRANALVLRAFAETRARGSIEHAQLLDDADIPRFARLGVVASVQPEHAIDDRDVADRYWAGRTRRAFVLRSLLDAGAVLALGSDAPVAPLDPWIGIAAAVHRTRGDREPWHPEQAITLEEALLASMPTSRRSLTLRVGDPADLVVLDAVPFTATPAGLRAMPVAATMVAGRWTHRTAI